MSHRTAPDPVVYTYPHPRDCGAIQGRLDGCVKHCSKCAPSAAPHYQPEDEDYELDMGLAGAHQ